MSGYVAQHGQPAGFNSHDQEWAQLPQLLASLRNPYPQGPRPSPAHYHLDRVRTGGSSENWTLNPRLFVNECPTESECADRLLGMRSVCSSCPFPDAPLPPSPPP